MNLGLEGKIVFITGSSQGIGYATAESFLREGATVIINARDEGRLKRAVTELGQVYPGRISFIAGDILKDNDYAISETIRDKFGKLDVFIANLGNGKPETKEPLDIDEWKRFFDINVFGNVKILSGLQDLLKKGESPSVVFISSIVAKEVSSAPIAYASAKSAVVTLSKYLSSLWAQDGIRVNCVLPGNIFFPNGRWEDLMNEDPTGVKDYINSSVPMKRFGKPEEVADVIVYLASERASFISGTTISVDGGQLRTV